MQTMYASIYKRITLNYTIAQAISILLTPLIVYIMIIKISITTIMICTLILLCNTIFMLYIIVKRIELSEKYELILKYNLYELDPLTVFEFSKTMGKWSTLKTRDKINACLTFAKFIPMSELHEELKNAREVFKEQEKNETNKNNKDI